MIKIFDCSNSSERPTHRHTSGGPKENDIISDLKKYGKYYDFTFSKTLKGSNVVITNDVFTEEVLKTDIPKVKRMDGIYWQEDFLDRNLKLNHSAEQADHVIFISKFSSKSLKVLYPEVKVKNETVILNSADDSIFYKKNLKTNLIFSASCTDWRRGEKRFNSLVELAKNIPEKIYLIGKCDEDDLPKNIIKLGYFEDYTLMWKALQKSTAFINLSYRDAAPKTVCQAVSCGMPVLFADSGGLPEMVTNGVSITDEQKIYFDTEPYQLKIEHIMNSYEYFKKNFYEMRLNALNDDRDHQKTLEKYFQVIKSVI